MSLQEVHQARVLWLQLRSHTRNIRHFHNHSHFSGGEVDSAQNEVRDGGERLLDFEDVLQRDTQAQFQAILLSEEEGIMESEIGLNIGAGGAKNIQ